MKTKIIASNVALSDLSQQESVKPNETTVTSNGKSYTWIGTKTKEYSLGQLNYWKTVGRALLKTVISFGFALLFSQAVRDDWKVVGTLKRQVAYFQEKKPPAVIKTESVASDNLGKAEPVKEEPVKKEVSIKEEEPQKSSPSAVPEPSLTTKPIALERLINRGSLYQIPVLNQTYRRGGQNECGFHAFKNALVGVCLGLGISNIAQRDFESPETFVEVFNWVKQSKGNQEGDASIAELHQALVKLSQTEPEALSPTLRSFQTLVKEHVISLINIGEDWNTGGLAISADADTLSYLRNLKELSHKPGPWTHAFVTGSDGHWITLIAQKDEKGSVKWFGTDSWNNQAFLFDTHLELLQAVLNDSQAEDWWQTMYDNAIGDWMRRKSGWIDEQGAIPDPENQASLLNEKSRDDYIHRIINGFDFLNTAGWLQGDSHQGDIIALRKFAICFQKAEAERRPELAAKLGAIAKELGQV